MCKSEVPGSGELAHLLSAREERAYAQKFLLGIRGVSCVLQISLNVPGVPKNMPEGDSALALAVSMFLASCDAGSLGRVSLLNSAGRAELIALGRDAAEVKAAAVEIEEREEWGRAIDADVITELGPVSRTSIGKYPRRCLLCDEPAKTCARARGHGIDELREEVLRLLALARR
ncbi:MAG: citrate lyase holo-[acyl-carrier protein] synthase [Synergistaceae bacterium]|jgi:holo-ACP synthase CitX|nr:citrate lyase holo-[acyl-carrier protein] synthase [Synergistaceae bacterium]